MSTMTGAAKGGGLFRHNIFCLFAAGFISVLVFQMGFNAIVYALGWVPNPPFGYGATKPLGVPAVWSFAFWGGIWGIVFGLVEKYFPQGPMYYVCAFLFGAILPILVLWFVVFPMKGIPMAAGWDVKRMAIQVLAHGSFGLGLGVFVQAFASKDAKA